MNKKYLGLLLMSALVSANVFTADVNVSLPLFTLEECQRGTTVLVDGVKVDFFHRGFAIRQLAGVLHGTKVTLQIPVRFKGQYQFRLKTFTVGHNLVQTMSSITDQVRGAAIANPTQAPGGPVVPLSE
jgi:hypothetical protein